MVFLVSLRFHSVKGLLKCEMEEVAESVGPVFNAIDA
jgi:hypothetical protein